MAIYQRTGNLRRAAKALRITLDNAFKTIDEETDRDPRILTSPEPMKIMGVALRQIGIDLIEAQKKLTDSKKVTRLTAKQRLAAGVFALDHANKLLEAWAKSKGAEGLRATGEDALRQLEEEERKLEREIARHQSPEDTTGDGEAEEAGDFAAETLGEDADDT